MGDTGWERGSIGARFALAAVLTVLSSQVMGIASMALSQASNETVEGEAHIATPQGAFKIEDNVNLVLLDVSVKDRRGQYVTGLNRGNFHVYEDGHAREITQFDSVDAPVTIGLVVDNSGSMRSKRAEVILAGLAFAKQSNPDDEFFVVNFNKAIVFGLAPGMLFTDNLQTLRAALYYGQAEGQTALYDAVAYALKHLELSHRDKRTLIVVSDGRDNVSQITFAELLKVIEASRATVYTIGLYDPAGDDLNPRVLRKISGVSGGRFFEPQSTSDVIPVFETISKDIRNCYTLGYVPDTTNDKRVVRSVKVTAVKDNGKLVVRTRTAYTTIPASQLAAQQKPKHSSEREQ